MSKYKIAFIDEFEEDIREFQRFANDTFEVIPLPPIGDIDELVAIILEIHVDAVIVDHNLIEFDKTNTINYLGNDIVTRIHELLYDFPVFVLTAYDEDAIDKNDDARIVFEKSLMFASKEQIDLYKMGKKFKLLVLKQIEKYYRKIEDCENRLLVLLEKSYKTQLTESEEQEIIKLDSYIEVRLNKKGIIPDELKHSTNVERLERILAKVDELLNKYNE